MRELVHHVPSSPMDIIGLGHVFQVLLVDALKGCRLGPGVTVADSRPSGHVQDMSLRGHSRDPKPRSPKCPKCSSQGEAMLQTSSFGKGAGGAP